jgi:glycosyltransferase involved in cell wall biosynthesis
MILLLAAALRERGVQQRIVVMQDGWLREEGERLGWDVTVLPSTGSLDVPWILAFRDLLKESKIRVVHTHLVDAGAYGCVGARIARVPVVVTEHGDVAMDAKTGFKFWLKLAIAQALARRVVPVSQATASALHGRLHFGRRKTQVIYNAIDANALSGAPTRGRARARFGVPDAARVVGTLGAMTAVKDHANLLRAHSQLPADVWCLIFGDGPLRAELSALAVHLETAERVVMPGFTQDVAAAFAALDVFCLPSRSEGLPLVLAEAIAAGKPAVCTAVGGVPEFMARVGGGSLVPPADASALAVALGDALERHPAPLVLPDEFQVETMAARYLSLYQQIVAN